LRFVFVKDSCPAYDVIAIRYFRENGMDVGADLTFNEAKEIRRVLRAKRTQSAVERQFCEYVDSWEPQPEYRPNHIVIIKRIFAGGKELSLDKLTSLESSLRGTGDRFLLSAERVAAEVAEFYTGVLLPSLKGDLAKGEVQPILKYIEPFDESFLPDWRSASAAELDTARLRVADNVCSFLTRATTTGALEDLRFVLEDHYDKPTHMKRPSYELGRKGIVTCDHFTQYVSLFCIAVEPDYVVRAGLRASRGPMVCEEELKPWLLPGYDVRESST
jgi:hypothetical protein